MTKLGAHIISGPRDGYGDFAAANPAVVIAVDQYPEIYQNTVFIFRTQKVFGDAPGDLETVTAPMRDVAWYWYAEHEYEPGKRGLRTEWQLNPADYYCITNEVGGDNEEVIRRLIEFERWVMYFANQDDMSVCILNHATGSPGNFQLWKDLCVPFILNAWAEGNIYGRHVYNIEESNLVDPNGMPLAGNPNRPFLEAAHLQSLGSGGIALTECGLDGGFQFVGVNRFVEQMTAYDRYSSGFPSIIGLCLWTLGDWGEHTPNWQEAIPELVTYMEGHTTPPWEPPMDPEPPPPPPPPPPSDGIDLAPYFLPEEGQHGPIYMLGNSWGEGPERTQLIRNGNFSYVTKNDNWERRYIGTNYIYLQADTSRSGEEFYTVEGPWLPRQMEEGEHFTRTENITVYRKDNCAIVAEYTFTSVIVFEGLEALNTPIGVLPNVARFSWLVNGDFVDETYWYAPGLGLVRWEKHTGHSSVIAEFVPSHEQPNQINMYCEHVLGEYIPDGEEETVFKLDHWPCNATYITQHFGENPDNYSKWNLPGHDGIDIASPYGDPVYAAKDGTVYRVHVNPDDEDDPDWHNYGHHIRLQHAEDHKTIYSHLSEMYVDVGQFVQAGQLIGRSGNSGNVWPKPDNADPFAGAHLHLSMKHPPGDPGWPYDLVDPERYLEGVTMASDTIKRTIWEDSVLEQTEFGLHFNAQSALQIAIAAEGRQPVTNEVTMEVGGEQYVYRVGETLDDSKPRKVYVWQPGKEVWSFTDPT